MPARYISRKRGPGVHFSEVQQPHGAPEAVDMRLLVLTAFIAAVSSGSVSDPQPEQSKQFPWLSGKQYRYEVASHTLAHLQDSASSGNAFKADFVIRVKTPGHLQARLENPQYGQFHQKIPHNMALPEDLQYQPVENLDKPFDIYVEGGRVTSVNFPSTYSIPHENLLKALISALQVDLSPYRRRHDHQDSYDKHKHQGVFKKMETDITGDCETLYSVSPVPSEWRRELPLFASEEEPIEIVKSKNYGRCQHRVAYHYGVPVNAEWTGSAHKHSERQFITHSMVSRFLVGKQGPIYKSETTSSIHVHPHLFGAQKAEVHSYVRLELLSFSEDNETEWPTAEGQRQIRHLLYSMSTKQIAKHDSSSSSSESSESHDHDYWQTQTQQRHRRSIDQPFMHRRFYRHSGSSSSSSSSSDSSSAYINDEFPQSTKPLMAALYMIPQAHGNNKQSPVNAQKLIQDIAQQLQNPNNMPKADLLSKFNILVRIIASMNSEQLAQTSRAMDVGRTSNNQVKSDMWMVCRDAVTQAGTPPAFQQIKTWILSKKIEGQEAAEVVSALPNTLRYPTKEIMVQFFELALSPEVQQQKLLSTATLIAATKLIRMGHVDNSTAHSYYPTHMYGRLCRKHDRFVVEYILPRLSKELKNYIEKGDSKAQDYIKAIGNLGHREILNVFTPYLEGQIKVSTYLRRQMVIELRYLAQEKDKYVRAVLYSILKNTAEPYEVRVAAILNIFKAHPTTAMMQVMAQMTNDDPSVQVRAFLQSGIEFISQQKHPLYWKLARTAEEVKHLVSKEKLGYQYSTQFFVDYYNSESEPSYYRDLTYIGSEDYEFPVWERVSWRSKNGGWGEQSEFTTSFSSVGQLVEYIKHAMFVPQKSETEHTYSAEKISKLLEIKRDERIPLEGSLHVNIENQEKFFSFNEEELNKLVNNIRDYLKEVENGVEKHYTKLLNQRQVSVMFPVAMGVPFIYKYKEPTVVHIWSKAKGKIDNEAHYSKDLKLKMDKEIHLTYARNLDGSVGFMDTLSNNHASVGVVNKLQINVPIKMNIEAKMGEVQIKIEPMHPEEDTIIFHYSVWPYSTCQKKDTLIPIGLDPATKLIEGPKKYASIDNKFGQLTGTVFHLQGYSYSTDYQSLGNLFNTQVSNAYSQQLLSNIASFYSVLPQRDIALTHYNLRYLGKESKNREFTFSAVYDKFYNQQQSGEMEKATEITDFMPNSPARRQDIAKRASVGIINAKVQIVDISATFGSQQKQEYTLTAAFANSPVSQNIRANFFAGRNSAQQGKDQINGAFKIKKPELSPLNFLEALHKEIKMEYECNVKYGEKGEIQVQGSAERSQKQVEYLQEHPLAKQCEAQISEGNLYQRACYEVLIKAHAPDNFHTVLTYKEPNPVYVNVTYQAYELFKHLVFGYLDEDPLKKLPVGKVEVEAQTSSVDNTLRFEMRSKYGLLRLNNVQIPEFVPYLLSFYRVFTWYDRTLNNFTNNQFQPFCSVERSSIRTFANREYNYSLSRSWHVVMHDEFNDRGKWDELVILTRVPQEKYQEIYISYKCETGKDLEVEIQPSESKPTVNVKTNAKKVSEGDLTMYWDDRDEAPLLQYYYTPEGILILDIRDSHLLALYDGERFVIVSSSHRATTRGICGRNSGERLHDYIIPVGIVDRPDLYAASYSLDENGDPYTQELKALAKQKAYHPKHTNTLILPSDEDWTMRATSKEQDWGTQKIYRVRNYQTQQKSCKIEEQVQYHENHGEICISMIPLPSCPSHCHVGAYTIQAVQTVCRSRNDQEFKNFRDQILKGENPKVIGTPQIEQYRVPTSCMM